MVIIADHSRCRSITAVPLVHGPTMSKQKSSAVALHTFRATVAAAVYHTMEILNLLATATVE
jgi:hypothetical protein